MPCLYCRSDICSQIRATAVCLTSEQDSDQISRPLLGDIRLDMLSNEICIPKKQFVI